MGSRRLEERGKEVERVERREEGAGRGGGMHLHVSVPSGRGHVLTFSVDRYTRHWCSMTKQTNQRLQ